MSDTDPTTEPAEQPAPAADEAPALDAADLAKRLAAAERNVKAMTGRLKKVDEAEAKEKTELERLTAAKTAADERIKTLARKAATAEAKAAAGDFISPDKAIRLIDLDEYIDDEGELDESGIKNALADLAKSDPYLLKATTNQRPARSAGTVAPNGDKPRTSSIAAAVTAHYRK